MRWSKRLLLQYSPIIKIKNNGELQRKMKESAKIDFKSRFSEERMADEYKKIYVEIMQKKHGID